MYLDKPMRITRCFKRYAQTDRMAGKKRMDLLLITLGYLMM